MIFIILRLILGLLLFIVILGVFVTQVNQGTTAADAANQGLGQKFFTQECLDEGTLEYTCATPENDKSPGGLADPGGSKRWDGCPNSKKYQISYGGCEALYESEEKDNVAYCCTSVTPQTCNLEGLRICYAGYVRTVEQNPCGTENPDNYFFDDGCRVDCSAGDIYTTTDCINGLTKCGDCPSGYRLVDADKSCTGAGGTKTTCDCKLDNDCSFGSKNCENNPACCGQDTSRACKLDCPEEYPNMILQPASVSDEDWGCVNGGRSVCCQK